MCLQGAKRKIIFNTNIWHEATIIQVFLTTPFNIFCYTSRLVSIHIFIGTQFIAVWNNADLGFHNVQTLSPIGSDALLTGKYLLTFWRICCLHFNLKIMALEHTVFFLHGATAPSGPGSPHYRVLAVKLRHTTVGRTPLDEWSAGNRDLYLTTHNTQYRQIFRPPPPRVRFEPTIPASERPRLRSRDHSDDNRSHLHNSSCTRLLISSFRLLWSACRWGTVWSV